MATLDELDRQVRSLRAEVNRLSAARPRKGGTGPRGPKGDPGAHGTSDLNVGSIAGTLSAQVLAAANKSLILPPGTYVLDDDVDDDAETMIALQHGAEIAVPVSRSLGSLLSFYQGGLITPASGIALSLTGRLALPPNHHAFDASAGGTFEIAATAIDRLTPYNFGAAGDNDAEDSAEVRAWLDAFLWSGGDANGGIIGYVPPGRFVIGGTMDTDERGDYLFARLNKTGAQFIGAGRRITSFRFAPTGTAGPLFVALRLEEQPETEPTLYQTVEGFQISANADTTRRKLAIDIHDGRRIILREVEVSGWTDSSNSTGYGSIGIRIRGRDIIVIADPYLDCDTPGLIDFNDVETEPLDGNDTPTEFRDASGKDDDHVTILRGGYQCNNPHQANWIVRAGVPVRNLEIQGDGTYIDGAILACVDKLDSGGVPWAGAAIAPRRRSNSWSIGGGRVEGTMDSTGWAIRIERHQNAKLQELILGSEGALLLAEGADCRRNALVGGTTGFTGAVWNGIRALGVRRVVIKSSVRYSGAGIPLEVDADCELVIEAGAELVPTEHKRRFPEHASQFTFIKDRLGHAGFLGFDHWYSLFEGSGTHASYSGAFPLGRTGSSDPVVQQLLDDWDRYWLGFTNVGGQRVQVGVVDAALAAASHSKMFGGVYKIDSTWTPGAITQLLNLAGDSNGPCIRMNTTGTLFVSANGVNGANTALNVLDGVPFLLTLAHNRTAGTLTALVTKQTGTREEFTGTYFAAPTNLTSQGWGAISGINSFDGWLTSVGIALDAKAEQSQATLHTALGWGT